MNKILTFLLPWCLLCLAACNPEARWTDSDVSVTMKIQTVSAGFVECRFSTNKEAYYLVSIAEADDRISPMTQQKQFMMLAIDSANLEYLQWRNNLLKKGEFNVAPFSDHALQYGPMHRFFSGLQPGHDYWIYAFAVHPKTLTPIGRLNLTTVHTAESSVADVHFEYRVRGMWDYIYPLDSTGNLLTGVPYICTTRDSSELNLNIVPNHVAAYTYFRDWVADMFAHSDSVQPYYGVQVIENDGSYSHLSFEPGHTYYTALSAFDGLFKQMTIYKFVWKGDSTNYLFVDSDDANIMRLIEKNQ